MKKEMRNLLLLAGVMIVLLIGYVAIELFAKEDTTQEEVSKANIPVTEFTLKDISFYSYKNKAYEIGFHVTQDGYVHYEDEAFPVNKDKVTSQLTTLSNLTAIQEITFTDKSEYGFEEPQITWSVTLSNGTNRNFALGDKALFKEAYYLLDEENNQIYLVDTSVLTEFSCGWYTLVQNEPLDSVSVEEIKEVIVKTNGEITTRIHYEDQLENPWEITIAGETVTGNSKAVEQALDIFNSYIIREAYEYNCQDFSVYGLETPTTVVTVNYVDSEEGKEKTLVFEFGNSKEDNYYCVRVNGSSYVYKMASYAMKNMSQFSIEALKLQEVVQSEVQ